MEKEEEDEEVDEVEEVVVFLLNGNFELFCTALATGGTTTETEPPVVSRALFMSSVAGSHACNHELVD